MALGKNALSGVSGKSEVGGAAGSGRSRLGRGLNSLIKVSVPAADYGGGGSGASVREADPGESTRPAAGGEGSGGGGVIVRADAEIEVARIRANPHQPRRVFNEAALKELADSIKSNGVIQPLVVRRVEAGEGGAKKGERGGALYELIAGERRWRAAQAAGLTTVPCHIKEVDALTQAQMALVENIQREDLNPVERAEGYRTLLSQLGLTQSELAIRLGEERSTVANFLRLLELVEPVKRMLREGALSVGHAKLIAGVADILEQERLGKLVVSQGLSVRNLEKVLAAGPTTGTKPGSKTAPPSGREAHFADLEKSIARQLGMRVQLAAGKGKGGKGKITLHYASLDQFDQLMSKLGVDAQ